MQNAHASLLAGRDAIFGANTTDTPTPQARGGEGPQIYPDSQARYAMGADQSTSKPATSNPLK